MLVSAIRSVRAYEKLPYWDIVYEWEDIFKEYLSCEFIYESEFTRYKNGIVKYTHLNLFLGRFFPNGNALRFEMTAKEYKNYYNRKDIIPYIIDFWITKERLKHFEKAYSNVPFLLISSAEAVDFLNRNNCKLIYYHLPLSLPDKHKISLDTKFEKKFDLVMFGRQNPVLKEYALRYTQEHPDFYYTYLNTEGQKSNYYTNRGEFIGECNNREQILTLLRQSKIGLYTTPSMDNNKKRTNGYNQVTPRILEFMACGCHVIARYKHNPDTEFYRLQDICPHTETYEQFEEQVDKALSTEFNVAFAVQYLSQHYTSGRVQQFIDILKENQKL